MRFALKCIGIYAEVTEGIVLVERFDQLLDRRGCRTFSGYFSGILTYNREIFLYDGPLRKQSVEVMSEWQGIRLRVQIFCEKLADSQL